MQSFYILKQSVHIGIPLCFISDPLNAQDGQKWLGRGAVTLGPRLGTWVSGMLPKSETILISLRVQIQDLFIWKFAPYGFVNGHKVCALFFPASFFEQRFSQAGSSGRAV
jgi:hypothetical protein